MFIIFAVLGFVAGAVVGALIGAVAGAVIGFIGRLFYPLIFVMNIMDGITEDFWLSHLWLIILLAAVFGTVGGIFGAISGWCSGFSE